MPDVVLDVGVKGMVNVLDACLKHNIGELVLASSFRGLPDATDYTYR